MSTRQLTELDRMYQAGQVPKSHWLKRRAELQNMQIAERQQWGRQFAASLSRPTYGPYGSNAYLNASHPYHPPGSYLNPIQVEVRRGY